MQKTDYYKLMPNKEKIKILSHVAKKGISFLDKELNENFIDAWYDYLECTFKTFIPEYYLSFRFYKTEWKNKAPYEKLKNSIKWLIEIIKDIGE